MFQDSSHDNMNRSSPDKFRNLILHITAKSDSFCWTFKLCLTYIFKFDLTHFLFIHLFILHFFQNLLKSLVVEWAEEPFGNSTTPVEVAGTSFLKSELPNRRLNSEMNLFRNRFEKTVFLRPDILLPLSTKYFWDRCYKTFLRP
jgi:hypothetical protein